MGGREEEGGNLSGLKFKALGCFILVKREVGLKLQTTYPLETNLLVQISR